MERIGIRTQLLFKRINEERLRTKQRILEDRTMAIIFSMAFTALTKEWIDFKQDFINIANDQARTIEIICREKFNVDLPGVVEELAMVAVRSPLLQKLKNR